MNLLVRLGQILARIVAPFGREFSNYYSHGRPILKSAGIAGAVGYPAFYALQQMLRERQRQQWREACDREPDAFELAA